MPAIRDGEAVPLNPDLVEMLGNVTGMTPPSEEQWEYVYRCGAATLFPWGDALPTEQEDWSRILLSDFSDDAARAPANRRSVLMGEWYSVAELIVLGVKSGALTNTQAAQFFRQACDDMRAPNASAGAIGTVRAIAGSGDLDEALATRLLRLTGPRREAFEEVKQLQQVPRLAALDEQPDPDKTLAALSGAVYAALLDPAFLLVSEDAQFLSRHNFAPPARYSHPPGFPFRAAPPVRISRAASNRSRRSRSP